MERKKESKKRWGWKIILDCQLDTFECYETSDVGKQKQMDKQMDFDRKKSIIFNIFVSRYLGANFLLFSFAGQTNKTRSTHVHPVDKVTLCYSNLQ